MSSTLSPPVLSAHPVDIGHRSEAAIWGRLVRHGYAVLLPCGVNQRYDLVIDDSSGFVRVQCKTGRLKNGVIEFRTCSTRSNTRSAMARDYVGEIDLFAVYCPENDGVYLVPSEGAPRRAMRLRVEKTRNRQSKCVRWAREYELPA
jgi:PD-(D/E)XK nuclease superfamily protein